MKYLFSSDDFDTPLALKAGHVITQEEAEQIHRMRAACDALLFAYADSEGWAEGRNLALPATDLQNVTPHDLGDILAAAEIAHRALPGVYEKHVEAAREYRIEDDLAEGIIIPN